MKENKMGGTYSAQEGGRERERERGKCMQDFSPKISSEEITQMTETWMGG
jgi:hypothetical protein